MTWLFSRLWSLEILIQLVLPIYLLARRLPRRPDTTVRLCIAGVLLLLITVAPVVGGIVTGIDTIQTFYIFSTLLAVVALIIPLCYDASLWQGLFCATAGYSAQNLASGSMLLAKMLVAGRPYVTAHDFVDLAIGPFVFAIVYVIFYLAFIRRVDKGGLTIIESHMMLFMFVVVACMIIGLDILIKAVGMHGTPFRYLILLRLAHAGICVFALVTEYELLFAKRMHEEKAKTERLLAEREHQYQLSRNNIEAINIKCHDIRHQIRVLAQDGAGSVDPQALADLEREVNLYEVVVETGNEALDTILTEKGLACSNQNIVLSVIADGAALGFMSPAEIYSLFGNALDNAITAVRSVADPEGRTISLTVRRRGGMVAISVENWYTVEPTFRDGLPMTTKGDTINHGFGMTSIRQIVQRYGGTLHTGTDGRVFFLNALIPEPAC